MRKKMLVATAALSVLAFPLAVADARPGGGQSGHGAEQVPDGAGTTEHPAAGQQPPENRHAGRRCAKPKSVGFAVQGSLASFTPESVTLDVKRANRHARAYIASAGSTFTIGAARVRFEGVTDADASGTVDFADVLPTDKVMAIGKVAGPKRGCTGDTSLTLRKLKVVRPEAQPAEASDES